MNRSRRNCERFLFELRVRRGICSLDLFDEPDPPAPDPNIGIAARENAALSKEMADVARDELAWNRQRWEEVKPIYNEIAQQQLGQMRTDADRSTQQWGAYQRLFAPVEERMAKDAMEYDSPERKERAAAAAAADVSASHDAAAGITRRTMESMGVNPGDPRYAAVLGSAGLARARDTAGAMNTARTNTELTGMSMRQGVAQFGRNMPATSIAQDAAALNAGSAASGTTTGASGARNAGIASAAPWMTGAGGLNASAGNLYATQYGTQMQGYNAAQQSNANKWGGLGQLVGTGVGLWAAGGFAMKDGGVVGPGLKRRETAPVIEGEYSHVREGGSESIDPTDGEVMDALMNDGYRGLPRRETPDGIVEGPGTSTSDSVPARLSDGEAVLNAEATQMLGEDFINKANRMGLQRRRGAPAGVEKYEGVPA